MIVLTMKDEKRLVVTQKVMDGTMDIIEGADVLSFSARQMERGRGKGSSLLLAHLVPDRDMGNVV